MRHFFSWRRRRDRLEVRPLEEEVEIDSRRVVVSAERSARSSRAPLSFTLFDIVNVGFGGGSVLLYFGYYTVNLFIQ